MISESNVTVGCPGFATAGGTRCVRHLRVSRHPGISTRPRAHMRGYDRRWTRLRLVKLSMNPVCENGDNSPAVEVDHVIPLRLGGRNRLSNLRSLCKSCHSRKTMTVDMPKIKMHEIAAGRGELFLPAFPCRPHALVEFLQTNYFAKIVTEAKKTKSQKIGDKLCQIRLKDQTNENEPKRKFKKCAGCSDESAARAWAKSPPCNAVSSA